MALDARPGGGSVALGEGELQAADDRDADAADDRRAAADPVREALAAWQLELHYQPVFAPDGEVCELEALLRWNHPEHGLLSAAEFLAAAGRAPAARPLTAWMLRAATAETARWRTAGHDVRVIVNLAAADLRDDGLPELILATAAGAGLPVAALGVEFSESAVAADPEHGPAALTRLAEAGIAVDLGNVGARAAGWLTVTRAPVSRLRIDRELVRLLPESRSAERVVAGLIGIAHDLGLAGLAVGVESHAAARTLIELGADGLQGFALCRPLPAAEVPTWLTAWKLARAREAVPA